MKPFSYTIIRAICALVLGVFLIAWPESAIKYLVIMVGAIFGISGLWAIIGYYTNSSKGYNFPVIGAGSLILGIILISAPSFFINILMYILGGLLIIAGINQIVQLNVARKWSMVPPVFYVIPVLILLAGLLVLINPFAAASIPFIILGVSCLVYGLSDFINALKFKKKLDKYEY